MNYNKLITEEDMENLYIWNKYANAFSVFEQYHTEEQDGKEVLVATEKDPNTRYYTQAEYDALMKNRPDGYVVKDSNGVPTLTAMFTQAQLTIRNKKQRIAELKSMLEKTDYMAIKYAEGFLSESEYLSTKQIRQSYRNQINTLEEEIKALEV